MLRMAYSHPARDLANYPSAVVANNCLVSPSGFYGTPPPPRLHFARRFIPVHERGNELVALLFATPIACAHTPGAFA